MMCKGEECAYAELCPLLSGGMDLSGSRCPLEIGLVLKRFEEYKNEFNIYEGDMMQLTTTNLVSQLVKSVVRTVRSNASLNKKTTAQECRGSPSGM